MVWRNLLWCRGVRVLLLGQPLPGVVHQQSWSLKWVLKSEVCSPWYKLRKYEFSLKIDMCLPQKEAFQLKIYSKGLQGSREPPSHHAFGLQLSQGHRGWFSWRMGVYGPPQTCNLKLSSWSKEKILWFNVSMNNSLWMIVTWGIWQFCDISNSFLLI